MCLKVAGWLEDSEALIVANFSISWSGSTLFAQAYLLEYWVNMVNVFLL